MGFSRSFALIFQPIIEEHHETHHSGSMRKPVTCANWRDAIVSLEGRKSLGAYNPFFQSYRGGFRVVRSIIQKRVSGILHAA